MRTVILAAGMGTRLRPVIGNGKQKTMAKYSDKPLLQRNIEILKENGLEDIVIVVNYKKEEIMDFFGDGSRFGVKIEYVVQKNPKGGTADAVKCIKDKITEEKFVLIFGDNIFDPKILYRILEEVNGYDGILCGKEVEDPSRFGILEMDGKHVKRIIEKPENPPSNLALTGLFVLPKDIFSAIERTKLSKRSEYELTDSIQILLDEGREFGFVAATEFWLDPSSKDEMSKAEKLVKVST